MANGVTIISCLQVEELEIENERMKKEIENGKHEQRRQVSNDDVISKDILP